MQKLKTIEIDTILSFFLGILGFLFLILHLKFYPVYSLGWDGISSFSKNLKNILPSFLFLFLFFLAFLNIQKKKLTFLKIFIGLVLGISFGMFFFALTTGEKALFENISFLTVFFKIIATIFLFSTGALFFTLFLVSLGNKFLKLLSLSKTLKSNQEPIISFFLGFSLLSFLGFFLAKLSLFTTEIILLISLGFLFWNWKKIIYYFQQITKKTFEITTGELLLGSILGSVIVLNFMQSFYPFSVGWDSANQYFLTTKILITENTLRTGIFPAFIEIVLAFWGKFMGHSGVQFLLNFWGSFLPISLFLFIKKIGIPRKINSWLTLSFFLLPALQFQLSKDLKLDLIFFQLIILAISLLKEKQYVLAIFFLGFSVLCKLTAFWFFPFLLVFLLYETFASNEKTNKKIKKIALWSSSLFLPLIIFSTVNTLEVGHFPKTKQEAIEIFLKGKNNHPTLKIEKSAPVKTTSYQEEVARYSGFKNNFFEKVFAIFSSPQIPLKNKQYVNLGFLWLSVSILFLLNYLFFWKKFKKEEKWTSGLIFSFALFWIFMGEGIAWYSLPFLGLLFPLFSQQLITLKLKKTQKVLIFFLIMSSFLGLYSRLLHTPKMNFLTAISWTSFPTETNKSRLEDLFLKEEKTVAEILNTDLNAKILRAGTMARSFIKNGDARILEDSQLDLFQKISNNTDLDGIILRLNQNNIRYLLIDKGLSTIEIDSKGTLHKKFEKLKKVINEALVSQKIEKLYQGNRIILVEVLK